MRNEVIIHRWGEGVVNFPGAASVKNGKCFGIHRGEGVVNLPGVIVNSLHENQCGVHRWGEGVVNFPGAASVKKWEMFWYP
jgi:hypothetical protein